MVKNWAKITNVGFHDKPLIFFYFCDLDFIDYCFNFGWYSRKWWQKKLKLWWYSWKAKKKLKPPGAQAGPSSLRFGLRPKRRPEGPAWAPSGFNLFYFCLPWNHQSFNFSATIFVKPPKIQTIINETRSQKKNERFLIKTFV